MSGTMAEADLILDLKASLQDAATVFTGAGGSDFKRHLTTAALAMSDKRPRTVVGSVTLVADQPQYDVPAGFHRFGSPLWGIAPRAKVQPWEKGYPGRLPNARVIESSADPVTRKLYLDPPPTAAQISALGAEFRFYYYAAHAINADAAKTTVQAGDRGLLLLRAQAEALRELAVRMITKPVVIRDGMASVSRNGTPGGLYAALMDEFLAAA